MMTTVTFSPVRAGRFSQDIVEQVKTMLFSARLGPGDRLPSEKELALQFGVSRITVRDALRVLESQGLIEIRVGAGGGNFVAEPGAELVSGSITTMLRLGKTSVRELVEARRIVETNIIMLAAERATAEDFQKMQTAIDRGGASNIAGDPHFTPHSVEFHVALAEAAKNQVLLYTVNSFRSIFYEVLEKLIPDPGMAQRAVDDHQAILNALKAHNGERACELMRQHLSYFEARAAKIDRSFALAVHKPARNRRNATRQHTKRKRK